MRYIPKPYQHLLIRHFTETPRCAGWAEMGLGKTSSTLTALDLLSYVEDVYPALVLAPLRVARTVWPRENLKWDHLKNMNTSAIVGTESERLAAMRVDANIYTINYENVPWLLDRFGNGKTWPFRSVVADESTKLKNFRLRKSGVRAQALGRIAFHPKVNRWINLTGTPAPNGLLDLWGQTWFLDHGKRLGLSYTAYMERYFRPNRSGYGAEPLTFAEEHIHESLKDLCLSIMAKDWFDLDAPIETTVEVQLPPKVRKAYRELEKKMFTELEGTNFATFSAAAKTNKCQQFASGAAYLNYEEGEKRPNDAPWQEVHTAKLDALEDIIEEMAGKNVLVVYKFKSDLQRLQKRFKQARILKKEKDEDDWNAGKIPIGLVHPDSIGHGANLQDGGHVIVYFTADWNLESHAQIMERIGPVRQLQSGYERPVFIYYIVAEKTIDEVVMQRLRTKDAVQSLLKQAMKRSTKE